jgi:hypothetical protein
LSSRPEWSTGLRPTQGDENGFCSATALHGSVTLPFVIPTGAYPDFLLPGTDNGRVCGFFKESRMKFANATKLDRKSGVA